MELVTLVVTVILVALLLHVVETYLPLGPPVVHLIRVLFVVIVIVWLLRVLLGWPGLRA